MSSIDTIISTIVENEGNEVELQFEEQPTVPSGPYNGVSHEIDTLSEKNIRATIETAEIEDGGETLISLASLDHDEVMRLDLNPDAITGVPAEVEIYAMRKWPEDVDTESDDVEELPWKDYPTATVRPAMDGDGHRQIVESGYSRSPPEYDLGRVKDVECENSGSTADGSQ